MSLTILNDPNKGVVKCNQIVNGLQTINFNTENNQIEFDNYSDKSLFYVNTITGQTNMVFDLNQLENQTINNVTINNLKSDSVTIRNVNIGDAIQKIQQNLSIKTQEILDIQTFVTNQQNYNQEFINKFQQQANQNLIFINELEEHLTRIQNLELFEASQTLVNNDIQNKYLQLQQQINEMNLDFTQLNSFMNNQIIFNQAIRTTTETLTNNVELIMKDYVVHDDLKNFATDSQITSIQASVALMGVDLAATTAIAGKAAVDIVEMKVKIDEQNLKLDGMLVTIGGVEAQSATVAAELQEVKAQQIIDESSMLQNSEDITLLKGTAADLTAKEAETDAKATTAQTTATDALGKLKTFITSQAAVDAALTATITGLSQTKADQKDTYSKGDIDAQQQLQDGRLDVLEASNQTTGEVYKQRFDNIDTNITNLTTRLTTDENTLKQNSMTIAGLSNAQMLMDNRMGVVETRTAPMVQQIQNIQSLDVTQNNRLAALENTDINIQNRCKAIEDVNASQDVTISALSGGVNGQITRVTALETLTNNWTPIMNCWGKPQDGWFQIQKDPTQHWDKITGFVQNTSLIINPKVDIYFGANNEYGAVPDRIILLSQKTIINPDRFLLHLFNPTLNKFEDKSIVDLLSANDLTNITTRVVSLESSRTTDESNIGVLQSRCNQIDELNQNQTNNITSLQNFQASQIQTNLSNATSITNLTNSVGTLQTDNVSINSKVSTLQNQMTDVINVNTNQSTQISNLQTQFNGLVKIENYYANNYSMTIGGFITFKWGEVDVGSNLGKKTVTFATPFSACVYAKFASVVCSTNSGGGADVGYAVADVNGVTVTADYANSGGNKSNVYSWLVIGW
ncbi:Hypothetical_protein [Hexamita inflata]|uniref:Hypothetical_protein n=1 Tax=Hexamita inflata TaxID=28002 RepID=A0AA86QIF5_9EUKA|nr:Hypothetical protein HINF_LOCUS44517 [Hexamita inflata]